MMMYADKLRSTPQKFQVSHSQPSSITDTTAALIMLLWSGVVISHSYLLMTSMTTVSSAIL